MGTEDAFQVSSLTLTVFEAMFSRLCLRESMGDGIGFVRLALFKHPLGPMVHGLVCPVVVASFQRFPALFRFGLPRGQQFPQWGHVDQHTVVNMWRVSALQNCVNALGEDA